jgi:hypothetical protein
MSQSKNATPFFIVGAPRSGTTLLREILRTHANLCCPAETHFFRWGHPFGGKAFREQYFTVPSDLADVEPIYRLHRKLDGIGDDEFATLLARSTTRAELHNAYLALYQARNGFEGRRCFDKSPQNIYGIFMLNAFYERPRFIHLVRNPLDVAASLIVGEVLRAENIVEACNYWLEAVAIFNQFKAAWPEQAFELKFERLAKSPAAAAEDLLLFIGEDATRMDFDYRRVNRRWRNYRAILSESDMATVQAICGDWMRHYGYSD